MGQASLSSLIIQLVIIGLLFFLFQLFVFPDPFLFAALTYVVLARLLRTLIAKDHRQGIKLVMQKRFNEAIPFFDRSYNYFSRNQWVDKYRFLTLFSATKSSYTQMALDNIAFCYSQLGNGIKAVEYYNKALALNPNDELAQVGLNMLKANANVTQI